jgi:opacity protein-like surface antigen
MKKIIILSALALLLIPSTSFADLISFRVGYFIPAATSDLWVTEFENMSFEKSDFQGANFLFSYEYFISNEVSFMLSVDGYSKQKRGHYIDYVGEDIDFEYYAFDYGEGYLIEHAFSVSITPIQASLKFTPLGRKGKFIPYVGGGGGIYLWTVRLYGEMIDFSAPELFYDPNIDEYVYGWPVFEVDARDEGKIAFGYHVFGGFMIPIANRMSVDVEFKYNKLTGNLTEGFEGFEPFDLGGYQVTLGINYWF